MTFPLHQPELVPKIEPEHLAEDLLSIVVYGPGEGEAIVVRLPDGSVGVVDGCAGGAVMGLLEALDTQSLAFACMTHPHEDHFLGLDEILTKFRGKVAKVWETGAVIARNYSSWETWMRLRKRRRGPLNDARMQEASTQFPDALSTIYREMANLSLQNGNAYDVLSTNKQLLPARTVSGADFEIWAWGPRASDVQRASLQLLDWFREHDNGTEPSHFDPNLTSGALLLRWGSSRILLAGDLCGDAWSNAHLAAASARVQVVNVAHHASLEAHDSYLWSNMRPNLAIVTPFQHANGLQPPKQSDVERLVTSCDAVAITAPPAWLRGSTPGDRHPHLPLPAAPSAKLKSGGGLNAVSSSAINRYNAVAVSMDAHGNIRRVVLAGDARYYR